MFEHDAAFVADNPGSFALNCRASNFWPLAIISMGESWHNSHHADPTCARHGVMRRQVDPAARLIWLFQKAGWVYAVRWPVPERLERRPVVPVPEPPTQ